MQSQLTAAEEELQDLQTQHEFSLQEDALNKFISDLDETLNSANESVAETFEEFAETLKNLLDASNSADVESSYQKIWDLLMGEGFKPIPATAGITDKAVYVPVTNTQEPIQIDTSPSPITTENGTYTPVTQDEYLSGLSMATTDITSYLDSTVNYLSSMNGSINELTKTIKNISSLSGDVNVTINYDNLINVDGNVRSDDIFDPNKAYIFIDQMKTALWEDLRKVGLTRTY